MCRMDGNGTAYGMDQQQQPTRNYLTFVTWHEIEIIPNIIKFIIKFPCCYYFSFRFFLRNIVNFWEG